MVGAASSGRRGGWVRDQIPICWPKERITYKNWEELVRMPPDLTFYKVTRNANHVL